MVSDSIPTLFDTMQRLGCLSRHSAHKVGRSRPVTSTHVATEDGSRSKGHIPQSKDRDSTGQSCEEGLAITRLEEPRHAVKLSGCFRLLVAGVDHEGNTPS